MALTKEQVKEIKRQLLEQVEHLPPEQKHEAINQIENMSEGSLELLLKQNQGKSSQEVFRLIVSGEIPSIKIDENAEAIAVLDIKPISEGHIVIIPKSPAKNEKSIPEQAKELAKSLAKKLKNNLNAKSVEILVESKFGETIINVIPVYDKPLSLSSQRSQSVPEKLQELAEKIKKEVIKLEKKAAEVIKLTKKRSSRSRPLKLNKRIP